VNCGARAISSALVWRWRIGKISIRLRAGGIARRGGRRWKSLPKSWRNSSRARFLFRTKTTGTRRTSAPIFWFWMRLKRCPPVSSATSSKRNFWGQMTDPNLLVESSVEDVGDLMAALACHVGEVRRNPYHARLPAWMMDNVRRGAELVGRPGGAAPDFTFATLYRLRQWTAWPADKCAEKWKNFCRAGKTPRICFKWDRHPACLKFLERKSKTGWKPVPRWRKQRGDLSVFISI